MFSAEDMIHMDRVEAKVLPIFFFGEPPNKGEGSILKEPGSSKLAYPIRIITGS